MRIQEVMGGCMSGTYKKGDVFQVVGYEAILYVSDTGICIMGSNNVQGVAISEGVMSGRLELEYKGNYSTARLRQCFGHLQLNA